MNYKISTGIMGSTLMFPYGHSKYCSRKSHGHKNNFPPEPDLKHDSYQRFLLSIFYTHQRLLAVDSRAGALGDDLVDALFVNGSVALWKRQTGEREGREAGGR